MIVSWCGQLAGWSVVLVDVHSRWSLEFRGCGGCGWLTTSAIAKDRQCWFAIDNCRISILILMMNPNALWNVNESPIGYLSKIQPMSYYDSNETNFRFWNCCHSNQEYVFIFLDTHQMDKWKKTLLVLNCQFWQTYFASFFTDPNVFVLSNPAIMLKNASNKIVHEDWWQQCADIQIFQITCKLYKHVITHWKND